MKIRWKKYQILEESTQDPFPVPILQIFDAKVKHIERRKFSFGYELVKTYGTQPLQFSFKLEIGQLCLRSIFSNN